MPLAATRWRLSGLSSADVIRPVTMSPMARYSCTTSIGVSGVGTRMSASRPVGSCTVISRPAGWCCSAALMAAPILSGFIQAPEIRFLM